MKSGFLAMFFIQSANLKLVVRTALAWCFIHSGADLGMRPVGIREGCEGLCTGTSLPPRGKAPIPHTLTSAEPSPASGG